jgi:hypothetical protein
MDRNEIEALFQPHLDALKKVRAELQSKNVKAVAVAIVIGEDRQSVIIFKANEKATESESSALTVEIQKKEYVFPAPSQEEESQAVSAGE